MPVGGASPDREHQRRGAGRHTPAGTRWCRRLPAGETASYSEAPRVIDSMARRTGQQGGEGGLVGCILFKPEQGGKKIYLEIAAISVSILVLRDNFI